MKEFKNAVELLTLCTEKNLPISEIRCTYGTCTGNYERRCFFTD